MKKVVLTDFHSLRPHCEIPQNKISQWFRAAHELIHWNKKKNISSLSSRDIQADLDLKRFSIGEDKIHKRGFYISDFSHLNWKKMRLFNLEDNPRGPTFKERALFYAQTVEKLFEQLYPIKESSPPEEIIHVTCTGNRSREAAQKLVAMRNWNKQTSVTHAYHMGCYAAIPASKLAMGILEEHKVDIVHTELCSLHFNSYANTPEQIIVKSLFADGVIKYSVIPFDEFKTQDKVGLEILSLGSEIVPNSAHAMTWIFGERNFEMTLSKDVPELIADEIQNHLSRLFKKAGLCFDRDGKNAFYALHPGGPKIIDNVQALLHLDDDQVKASLNILYDHGNMSSATLPYVWKKIVENDHIDKGCLVVSLAFGPGLTIASILTKKV